MSTSDNIGQKVGVVEDTPDIQSNPGMQTAESEAIMSHSQSDEKKPQMMALADIQLSDDYRFRNKDDEETIDRYAERIRQYLDDVMENSETSFPFPPIYVLLVDSVYVVIAGRHRFQAAQKAGMTEMSCIILTDHTEAIRIGLESNRRHGLPLNNADKTHCIKIAVTELTDLSNRMIADWIGCSDSYVGRVVKKCQLRTSAQLTKGKDGKVRPAVRSESKPIQQHDDTENEAEVPELTEEQATKPTTEKTSPVKVPETTLNENTLVDGLERALAMPPDSRERSNMFVDIVAAIIEDCFEKDSARQKFLKILRAKLAELGV